MLDRSSVPGRARTRLGPDRRPVGEGGGSNFSFLLERDGERFVLRRPPRPPLPPSAHDMVREARLQLALAPHGVRLPTIRAVCEDESVLGVPFYVMDYIDADVVTNELPPGLETEDARRALGLDLVDTLVEIHAVDVNAPGVADFIRPGSYLERQVRRFTELWASTRRATCLPSSRSGSGSPRTCRSPRRSRSSTATTGSGT